MQPTFVRVIATLKCRSNSQSSIVGRTVRLYDADPLSDDFLASSTVDPEGTAAFLFDLSLCQSLDSLFETKPDLYCVVAAEDGRVIYRSTTHANTDFLGIDPNSGEQHRTIEVEFEEA
jgi:hypothetical protein